MGAVQSTIEAFHSGFLYDVYVCFENSFWQVRAESTGEQVRVRENRPRKLIFHMRYFLHNEYATALHFSVDTVSNF